MRTEKKVDVIEFVLSSNLLDIMDEEKRTQEAPYFLGH